MIAGAGMSDKAFKRAVIVSAVAHSLVLILIIINPSLPKPSPKGVIHYLSMNSFGGGGGGGGDGRPAGGGPAGGASLKTEPGKPEIKRETLRDLTIPRKLQPKVESKLRYPTDDPKTKTKPVPGKKASITKPEPGVKTTDKGITGGAVDGKSGGGGSSLKIGPGGTGTGEGLNAGLGEGFGGGGGLADFPYAFYLQIIQDKITINWFPGSIDPGPDTVLQTVVYFRIYRDGSISKVEVKISSGLPNFDLMAQRAVTDAGPFPPLPPDYEPEYLGIRLLFEHAR
jgi:TonB family protein